MKPRLLDLFCGAGGAAWGYFLAGYDVLGVDSAPQPNYPFEFRRGDALAVLREFRFPSFAAIHASPPCQAYTGDPRRRDDHPDLVPVVRELLKATGRPYVIENVPGAPMPDAFLLCGSTFGLPIVRHRLFETNFDVGLVPSLCHQETFGRAVDHGPGFYPYGHGKWRDGWREHVLPVVWPWMTLDEAGQAIPPAYTEWIGTRLVETIGANA